jgi:hypothetical protein
VDLEAASPVNNVCQFSPCRTYRYALHHDFDAEMAEPPQRIMWIGLNPSTADEQALDPTLRRIRDFSRKFGFTTFVMTNLFAFRATYPKDMKKAIDPVGPDNDDALLGAALTSRMIIAAWGTDGTYGGRAETVKKLLHQAGHSLHCLARNDGGSPKHPLYLKGDLTPIPYSAT